MPVISNLGPPVGAGSTLTYNGQIVDPFGIGIPASAFSSLTLTIVDTFSGVVINGCDQADILNNGRGTIDEVGNLTVMLETGDTSMSEVPGVAQIQRSLVINWEFETLTAQGVGNHQANIIIQALAFSGA